jgi:hypothetical protein
MAIGKLDACVKGQPYDEAPTPLSEEILERVEKGLNLWLSARWKQMPTEEHELLRQEILTHLNRFTERLRDEP